MKATEDIPYPASVHHAMHLPRLEALVRLMGVSAPASGTARVLELGCAYGTSLLALAEMLPQAEFLGLDIDGAAIREAEATARAAGISNARFLETEDMPAAVAGREFDYILAHGLFSWVPDEVKEQIFSIFRGTLAPNGIAYINYNCLPGWLHQDLFRGLLLSRYGELRGQERMTAVKGFLTGLHGAMKSDISAMNGNAASTKFLRGELDMMLRGEEGWLAGDHLSDVNEPCYFSQFMGWAAEYGLGYLMDAIPRDQFLHFLPAEARRILAGFEDPIEQQQMLDVLVNRRFRTSLLMKAEAILETRPALDVRALDGLFFRFAGRVNISKSGKVTVFTQAMGAKMEVEAGLATGFTELAKHYPAAVGFADFPGADRAALRETLIWAISHHFIEPLPTAAGKDLKPIPETPLNRWFASKHGKRFDIHLQTIAGDGE